MPIEPTNNTELIDKLLESNHTWSIEQLNKNSHLFKKLSMSQNPKILWLGCSDSRVSPEVITKSSPGTMFVLRNIANRFSENDLSAISALQFALFQLNVTDIIVCGHTGCGGIEALFMNNLQGPIKTWISHLKDDLKDAFSETKNIKNEKEKIDKLIISNVTVQINNIKQSSPYLKAKSSRTIHVHGLIYNIANGSLKEIT